MNCRNRVLFSTAALLAACVVPLNVACAQQTPPAGTPSESMQKVIDEAKALVKAGKFTESVTLLGSTQAKLTANAPGSDKREVALARAQAYFSWAEDAKQKGDFEEAIAHYKSAYPLFAKYQRSDAATTMDSIGGVYGIINQLPAAITYFEQALVIQREIQDANGEAASLSSIGASYHNLRQFDKAIGFNQQAVAVFKRIKNLQGESEALGFIGTSCRFMNRNQEAIGYFEQALAVSRELTNRPNEGGILAQLGSAYNDLNQSEKAIVYFEQAAKINHSANDFYGEAYATGGLGDAHASLGQNEKAIGYFEKALALNKQMKDPNGEGYTLSRLGAAYSSLGQHEKAIDYFEQTLNLIKAANNPQGEGVILNNLGTAYLQMSRYGEAISYFGKALTLSKQIMDERGEASASGNSGSVYVFLSQPQKALSYYEQALDLSKKVNDRRGESIWLSNLAGIYTDFQMHEKAIRYYEQSLDIQNEIKDQYGVGITMNNLGFVYDSMGQPQKAITYYEKSLLNRQAIKDRQGEGATLNNLGTAYDSLNQHSKAVEYYEQSLGIIREVKDRQGEAKTLSNLLNAQQKQTNPNRNLPLAAFWGKQAVNVLQSIRGDIAGLDKDTQKGYLRANADTYRLLADVLFEQGRTQEALQVLALLKDDEQFQFLRQRSEKPDADALVSLALSPEESKARADYALLADKVSDLGGKQAALQDKQKRYAGKLEAAEAQQLAAVTTELGAATMAFDTFVTGLPARFPKTAAVTTPPAALAETKAAQAYLKTLANGDEKHNGKTNAAFVALLVGEKRTWIVVTTATEQFAVPSEVSSDVLSGKVAKLRTGLLNANLDPRPMGKQVYDLLLKPVEKQLAASGIQTLLVSLDGTVRYIPLAALSPDGKTYLLETYQLASLTPRRAAAPAETTPNSAPKVLGLGVTRAYDVTLPAEEKPLRFPALPGVKAEVAAVTKSAGSVGLLDDKFTPQTLLGGAASGFPVVHIASHFRIGADIYRSFLLTGDGKPLTLAQMLDKQTTKTPLFAGVDFLILSACDTATGDLLDATGKSLTGGREVDSFALIAQEQGAQTILATLWPVSDASTVALMREFYRLRAAQSTPNALWQAQKALLAGKLSVSGTPTITKGTEGNNPPSPLPADPELPPYQGAAWTHPYYWGPFVLIGGAR